MEKWCSICSGSRSGSGYSFTEAKRAFFKDKTRGNDYGTTVVTLEEDSSNYQVVTYDSIRTLTVATIKRHKRW